jgi:hypothetical protein
MDWTTFTILLQIVTIIWWIAFWFAYLKKDIDLIKKDAWKIEWMEKFIEKLSDYFEDNDVKWIPKKLKWYKSSCSAYYTANSPLKLNDKWNELIKNSWFDKIVKNDDNYLIKEIERKVKDRDEKKIFYYIEKESIDLIQELEQSDDKIMERIGLFIFKNWLLDDKKPILNALSLYLRDEVINSLWLATKFKKLFEKKTK